MAYKTLRNQVLRDATRLITGTYHGSTWTTPDGFLAINVDLYDGYTPKKEHQVIDQKVSLDMILDKENIYALAEYENINSETSQVELSTTASDVKTTINSIYLDLFRSLYPNATPHIAINSASNKPWYEPVRIYNGSELVGVIMPVKT